MRSSIARVALVIVTAGTLSGCEPSRPAFEVMGLALDKTTLEAALRAHPSMECDRFLALGVRPIIPGYRECRVGEIDVAGIRSSLGVDVDREGIVTAIAVHGQPYDGPFGKFSKAMTEKYGAPVSADGERATWNGSNGRAVLVKSNDGGALLRFEGARWKRDAEALERDFQKGKKF